MSTSSLEPWLVVVLCRPPAATDCKTRLARELGRATARRLYIRCLEQVLSQAAGSGATVRVAVAGHPTALAPYVARCAPDADIITQVGASFAARQAHQLDRGIADGYRPVTLVGSDLVDLDATALLWSQRMAASGVVAIVPAADGGYSLLSSAVPLPELADVPMSRSDTTTALAETVTAMGKPVAIAPFMVRDLDLAADLPASWDNFLDDEETTDDSAT